MGQKSKNIVFANDKKSPLTQNLDSVLVFKSKGNDFEFDKAQRNVSSPFEYTVNSSQVYQFIFYHSCCVPFYKIIDTDSLKEGQIIKVDFGEKLINLKELEVKEQRDRFSQSGDTTFIFTNPDDTRPHAAASSLFDRVIGLSNDLGRISVLGKTVREVTIDGRRLFGGQPSLSLDAIKADMIEHMEFVEKLLPSGQTTNSLNIKLKNDSKNMAYGTIDAARGFDKEYLANGRVNKITNSGFFNAFVTSNTINKRGLDTKSLDLMRMNAFGDAMNTTGSVIGLYDNGKIDFEDNFSAFEAKLQGTNRYSDAGFNYTLTKSKLELNSFIFANDLIGNVNQYTYSQIFLGKQTQHLINEQTQLNNERTLNGSISLKYKLSERTTFRFSNFLNLAKGNRNWTDYTISVFDKNMVGSENNLLLKNNNTQIENAFNSSLILNGKKPGTLTSFLINYQFRQNLNDNQFENDLFFNRKNFLQKGTQNLRPILNTGKLQINHAKPITKRILLEANLKFSLISNSNKLTDKLQFENPVLKSVSENNKLLETGLYALYQRPKIKVITGINYLYWDIKRQTNQEINNKPEDFLISPFTKIETKINKNPLWLRFATEVNLPSWSQVGSLPDSSNINKITNGNIFLNPYLQRNLELGTSASFKNGVQTNFTVGYTKYLSPIISDNLLNPVFNVISNTYINSPNANESFNINLRIFRIKMNGKFSFFNISSFNHLKSYQKTNETFSQIKTNVLYNNANATFKYSKNVILKLSLNSTLNWLKGNLIFTNNLTLTNNLELGKKWYFDTKIVSPFFLDLNKDIGLRPIIDFELGKYFLKNNNFKGSFFLMNLVNYNKIRTVSQSANFQSNQTTNYLPRVIGFQITFYPETLRKK